ncbi:MULTISPECIES: YhgE/Pip family protein [Prauserella salsuginis group]|uniref:YhgE/Pip family protein n=1 Tax=Prauserella salsuginis TaxID=387889 RepID=A0ABW6G1S3_9PSEU|nr:MULTISPECIES: YhgE/Pip domain-containing protein [Prauserella salsuginis group]MCR3722289.1 putative membrane protein [Prauserella flava]MCR3736287.1 putative membrane protein [Prauserella salsuginis]
MNAVHLARNELRRLTTGTLPKLAIAALVLVPLLYASLYLYSNYDPYGRLDNLPAAIVNNDTGSGTGENHREVGREVTDELQRSGDFDWHEVSEDEAHTGVSNGDYAFAITIPRDFSKALTSSEDFEPRQAGITLTTNDTNNYLSHTIADQVAEEVRNTIAEKVGTQAADRFLVGFSTIHERTEEAANGARELAGGALELRDGQQQLATGASQLATGSNQLSSGLSTLKSNTENLPEQTQQLATGANKVAAGNEQIAATASALAQGSTDLQNNLNNVNDQLGERLREGGLDENEVQHVLGVLGNLRSPVDEADNRIQQTSTQLNTLATGSRQVANGAQRLAGSAPQLSGGISQAADGAAKLSKGASSLDTGEQDALNGTKQLLSGANELRDGLNEGLHQIPNTDEDTREATARTIADPVAVDNANMASAGTYGAGLAPFFIGLATWIGAFVLFLLLRPLSTRALTAGASPLRVALGGWLSAALLGTAQVVVLFAAVTWLVGIHVANPVAALGFAVLTSLTFTAIVHALNALFGAVGKFLGLVLLVLQLVSAGGTFPWQTLPDALQPLHAALPMGYVIDGLRHLLYSGASAEVLLDVGVLVAYLAAALTASTLAARRRRMWTVSHLKPELAL